ncbi:class I SAM-dependent DNA methyltransferase [Desulfovirgula thermocuniculi]|uniref:class I SAM-dependent DNA methyltransferase n=1 Tax=Desulfovirgula thermocuniculi TaxID=348842 RepID=UPI000427FAED|nr:class I SAM-dependent methyltransferase [Desulfovirgula thermocuniculi]
MKPYERLARIYDLLVAGVDYEEWAEYLQKILRRFGHCPRTVLDLACGTGNLTLPLARRGYRVLGLDISPAMISAARKKAAQLGLDVEFLVGDMRSFELKEPVDLVTCFHDGINYLPGYRDLVRTFRRVYENLNPGGLFIFDANNIRLLLKAGGTSTPDSFVLADCCLCWQTRHYPQKLCWEVELAITFKDGEGTTGAFKEIHREYHHSPERIRRALEASRLMLVAVYDAFTFSPPAGETRRHFYVARKRS